MTQLSKHQVDAFGHVAVVMGGAAAEREISLRSGRAISEALTQAGVKTTAIDWDGTVAGANLPAGINRGFIALHGRGGEDGKFQALLDLEGVPYTGSEVLGCALAMDKLRSKTVWSGAGLATPEFVQLHSEAEAEAAADQLGLPIMIKPAREGSSFGISKVNSKDAVVGAYTKAREFDHLVMAERCIDGDEYTVSILNGSALPSIRIRTPREFYDFTAKYDSDSTEYICPCGLSQADESALQDVAVHAFDALGCSGWGRVDFMRDQQGRNWLIEANTVPGMTDHSLVPMAAKTAGLSFQQLVVAVLSGSLAKEVQQ